MKKIVLDIEVYRNYFLCSVMNMATGNTRLFEKFDGCDLDVETIRKILKNYQIITFNGINYDMPILALALAGASNAQLKHASDRIIKNNLKPWHIERQHNITIPQYDHVDLFEVAPGRVSLKAYGGRIHSAKLQDLPIDPDAFIREEDRDVLRKYCINDLNTTRDLYNALSKRIALREDMSKQYRIDLRSKSDAQIAEAVIKSEVEALNMRTISKSGFTPGDSFRYEVPDFIKFQKLELIELLKDIENADFVLAESGKVIAPSALKRTVKIGNTVYQLGIGGMHSTEKSISHVSGKYKLNDWDVEAYYPSIILRLGLHPSNMGTAFNKVYRSLVERRIKAKAEGDKVANETLKITINGSFGKFGSPYSILYSPNLLIQTTVTGQLSLLMLVERFEKDGIPVVSGNTDGVVAACPNGKEELMVAIVKQWEEDTGFKMERNEYAAIYSRDVNNYIAIKSKDGVKLKGVYAESGITKNPSADICTEAVVAYLERGKDIIETICNCRDIKKFLMIRSVSGGALDADGNYLGRVARWYYSTKSKGNFSYKVNGNKVPLTDGAAPCMDLGGFPDDVDFLKYIDDAFGILFEVGHA